MSKFQQFVQWVVGLWNSNTSTRSINVTIADPIHVVITHEGVPVQTELSVLEGQILTEERIRTIFQEEFTRSAANAN